MTIYRKHSHLAGFWQTFAPSETEFLITYRYAPGNFGIGTGGFFLTNQRLVIWDVKRKTYFVLPLNHVIDFESENENMLIIKIHDDQVIQVNVAASYLPKLSTLRSLLTWTRSVPNIQLGSIADTVPTVPGVGPTTEAIPTVPGAAKKYCANKYAVAASSIVFFICVLSASTGHFLGFLPVFILGLAFVGIGYAVGYIQGMDIEAEEKQRQEASSQSRQNAPKLLLTMASSLPDVTCPECATGLRLVEARLGGLGECPKCGATIDLSALWSSGKD